MKSGYEVQGFDVSHHNGEFDFSKRVAAGDKFCFVKATEGNAGVDQQFKRNWAESARSGLLVGAYHFFHPNIDPTDQVNNFLTVKGKNRIGDLPCVLDWEITGNVRASVQKKNALMWLHMVEIATGKIPIVYSYKNFLNELGDMSEFFKYPLWLAQYNDQIQSPTPPAKWPNWTFWQHSDGGKGGVDLNVFWGNLSGLRQMAGVT